MIVIMIGHKGLPAHSGGVERHVEGLSTELARQGVRVISFDRKWYVKDLDPVCGVERRWSYGIHTKHLDAITHSFTAICLAKKEKPDVIHLHGVGPSLLIPFAKLWMPHAKIVSTFHSMDRTHAKWGWFARTMLRAGEWMACTFAHRTIVISERLGQYCSEMYGSQTYVIPNGVCVPEQTDEQELKHFSLKKEAYFAVVARLLPVKNIHVAIEAHRLMSERNPEFAKNYPLVIIGDSAFTSEYAARIHAMADAYPHARMVGEQSGSTLYALEAHALAHLSVSSVEGMSIALLEAMAYARPIIVSDILENTNVVQQDALITQTNDASSVSMAMERMIQMKEAERRVMGERLKARVRANHDWSRIAGDTIGLYQEA